MNEDSWGIEDVGGQPSKGLNIPHRTPVQGSYEIRVVNDEEMGKCLELELKPEGKLWPLMYEHTWIATGSPLEIGRDGREALGVWIKGNSSGGDVIMEISGSDNKKTQIRPDPLLSSYIDFDGWTFASISPPVRSGAISSSSTGS